MVFGNSLSAGTATDATVTDAKIADHAVNSQTDETSILDDMTCFLI